MKIAHINFLPYDNQIGVEKKLYAQSKAAFENNFDIDFYLLNQKKDFHKNNFFMKKISANKFMLKFFRAKIIEKYVPLDKYDYFILRYPSQDFSTLTFAKKYSKKLISEHHTFEEAEALAHNLYIRFLLEKYLSPLFIKNTKSIIGVTSEICDYENNKISSKKPCFVFSNGIDVDSIPFTKFRPFDSKELNIIFVASYFAKWHGLDLILDELIKYDGYIKIKLHLAGDMSQEDSLKIDYINNNKNNVIVEKYGKIEGDKLDKVFAISTIAISSIAISTKKMNEACALKTREYIARGIPFVYGYKDTDLNGDEEFCLKINKFNIYQIIDFAHKISNLKGISSKMRNFAYSNLCWKIKLNKLYSFLMEIDNV